MDFGRERHPYRDDNLADALTSVPLSKKYNAPILMTSSDQLDEEVWTEIRNLQASNVMIIGGDGAISPNIESELKNYGYSVERIAGADRYETAAQIASKFNSSDTVYLAYGHGEPDALAASSFAAINSIPILLTDKTGIPEATQKQLDRLNPSEVILLGGDGVIDSEVETGLKKKYMVERWGGADRYETGVGDPEKSVYR
jgi:putative cell wall-binding protein